MLSYLEKKVCRAVCHLQWTHPPMLHWLRHFGQTPCWSTHNHLWQPGIPGTGSSLSSELDMRLVLMRCFYGDLYRLPKLELTNGLELIVAVLITIHCICKAFMAYRPLALYTKTVTTNKWRSPNAKKKIPYFHSIPFQLTLIPMILNPRICNGGYFFLSLSILSL